MTRRAAIAIVVAASVAAVAPIPAGLVERWYSTFAYPEIQRLLTTMSNIAPFALFDLLLVAAICAFAIAAYRYVRALGWRRGALRLSAALVLTTAATYLVFLGAWGLNYRRVALTEKVAFDMARITGHAAHDFGEANTATLNRLFVTAHASVLSLDALAASFDATAARLGRPRAIVPGRPKPTILGGYFHQIAVSGMTDPFLLETLLAPDLFDVERPFVIAHEWAHLAGYADESEANYVAWLTCRHGDALAQYSAALILDGYVPPAPGLHSALLIGPRTDLWAMQYRYASTSPTLRVAARRGYDTYLKANRVEKGVESYDAVVQLILGTELDTDGYPRRR